MGLIMIQWTLVIEGETVYFKSRETAMLVAGAMKTLRMLRNNHWVERDDYLEACGGSSATIGAVEAYRSKVLEDGRVTE